MVLLGQLDAAWRMLAGRLDGLTDAEYFWEPATGCWSLRRRGAARSGTPFGSGQWQLDFDLLAWTNLEFAHHAAEVVCLRDLYRARS